MRSAYWACLLVGSVTGSLLLAEDSLPQDKHPFSRLCGNLRYVDRKYEGNVVKGENEKRLRKMKLQLYDRSASQECCDTSQLVQEQVTGFWGGFNFKKLEDGKYWLVAQYHGVTHKMPIRIKRDKKDGRLFRSEIHASVGWQV